MNMETKAVDKSAHYALKNRLERFKLQYKDKLGNAIVIDESFFEPLAVAWENISGKYPENWSYGDLKEEDFELVRSASEGIYERLRKVAVDNGLGGVYANAEGKELNE